MAEKNTFLIRYLAEKINLKRAAGSLSRVSSVLAKATIDLNPHQIHAALFAFNSPLSRGSILADEVGLGKTIEAGIVVAQLWAEGKRRILILCPASLRNQWKSELLEKFGIESEVWDGPSFRARVSEGGVVPLSQEGIFIVSYNFVYGNLGLVEKQPWDLIIIDEAHRFRRVYRGRDASKMAYEIRRITENKPKILLTATPLQNSLEELYGIVSFIDDKLLGSPYGFKSRFVQPIRDGAPEAQERIAELRRLVRGDESEDPTAVSGVLNRTLRKQVKEYVDFRDRTSITFDFTPTDEEWKLYEDVSAYLQRPVVAAIATTQRNLMILVYRKLLASSSFAIAGTLRKLADNLLRELQMRQQEATPAELNPESFDDEGLEEELEESELESEEAKKQPQRVGKAFSDATIKKELAELESYYDLARRIQRNTKGDALIEALQRLFKEAKDKKWPPKAVVFTESTRTQEYLGGLLRAAGISYTQFNGSNTSPNARKAYEEWRREFPESAAQGSFNANVRQALLHEFKNTSQVLLSTEAGAEGLNLQFCNIVINFDLPWNPQRVEQRIGRCHRYGQRHEVIVANFLNTKNHADRRVLELLKEKLNLFEGLFGASDEVLGALESGIDFEKRILGIYQSCKTPEEYDKAFAELQEQLQGIIGETTQRYRQLLLEGADQTVSQLFRATEAQTQKVLSDFDQDLLSLCRATISTQVSPAADTGIYSIEGNDFPVAFRELKEDEIGKISRAHKELPVIAKMIANGLSTETVPVPVIKLRLSDNTARISQLEGDIGSSGYLILWKLVVKGVDTDEVLVPMLVMNRDGKLIPLEVSVAESALRMPQVVEGEAEGIEVSEVDLLKLWGEWKEQILAKYNKRNQNLFERENERINRFYDDFALDIDDKIRRLQEERQDVARRRDNSADFEERTKLNKRLQEIQIEQDRLVLQKLRKTEEGAKLRKDELEKLWELLEMQSEERMIAIAKVNIV